MALEYDVIIRDGSSLELRLEGRPTNPESCYLLQDVRGLDGPDLSETVLELPEGDGDYLGAVRAAGRVLVLEGMIVGVDKADLRQRERALRAALAGGADLWTARIDGRLGDPENLTAAVRVSAGGPFRSPDSGTGPRRLMSFGVALRSPDPVLYGVNAQATDLEPVAVTSGRTYPRTYPRSYAGADSPGVAVVNLGDAPSWPVLRIYGPITDAAIDNMTAGDALELTGTIDAGQFVEVDTAPSRRTLFLDGDPGISRYTMLDRSASRWWPLQPGTNVLRLRALSYGTGARVAVAWRNAYR